MYRLTHHIVYLQEVPMPHLWTTILEVETDRIEGAINGTAAETRTEQAHMYIASSADETRPCGNK